MGCIALHACLYILKCSFCVHFSKKKKKSVSNHCLDYFPSANAKILRYILNRQNIESFKLHHPACLLHSFPQAVFKHTLRWTLNSPRRVLNSIFCSGSSSFLSNTNKLKDTRKWIKWTHMIFWNILDFLLHFLNYVLLFSFFISDFSSDLKSKH